MVRLFIDLCNLFFLWVFLHVGAFFLMVVAIVYITQTNKTPLPPIIHEHYSTVKVVEPPKRVLIEEEICTRLDGCPIVNNVCVDCLNVKN